MDRTHIISISGGALAAFLLSWWISDAVFHRAPLTTDEQSYMLQAQLFSTGRIKYPPPPFIEPFRYPMVIVDKDVGWLSRYPPGHALWLGCALWVVFTQSGVAALFRFATEDSATALQIPFEMPALSFPFGYAQDEGQPFVGPDIYEWDVS